MAKTKFSAEREALVKSLARFDGDIEVEEVTGPPNCQVSAGSNHTLLLHTILEAYCSLVEPNPVMREPLFSAIEKLLIQNQIIDPHIMLDNFSSVRRNLACEFTNRVKQIHNTLVPSPKNTVLTPEFMATAFPPITNQNWYNENFEQVRVIAEGGFGTVCLAIHKVDGIEYAVKKIVFKYRSDADYVKVLREVKSISTLNHLNIVSYYNAWMEALYPSNPSLTSGQCGIFDSEAGLSTASDESSSGSSESCKSSFSRCSRKDQRSRCATILTHVSEENSSSLKNSQTSNLYELSPHSARTVRSPHSRSLCKEVLKKKLTKRNLGFDSGDATSSLGKSSFNNASDDLYCAELNKKDLDIHSSSSTDSDLSTPPFTFKSVRKHESSEKSISIKSSHSKDSTSFSALKRGSNESGSSTQSSVSTGLTSLVHSWPFNKIKVILYIQMEYCQCDLRHWLDQRSQDKTLPFQREIKDIFKDILCGVAYIHSKSIIHRDLKPQNIFFSTKDNVMKIGDFGLSTLGLSSPTRHKEVYYNHSSGLGTVPYAAPEQRKKRYYDSKVDIYSLGIILIELLLPFQTFMEFSKTIQQITRGNVPKQLIDKGPDYVNLVKNLVQENPKFRMSAKDILDLPLIQDGFEIDKQQLRNEIEELREALQQKEKEWEKALTEKDNIIRMLQNTIKKQSNTISRLQRS